MAKKNEDVNRLIALVLQLAGIVLFSVFLINSYLTFKKYSKKYILKNADIRVNDSGNLFRYIHIAIGLGVLMLISLCSIYYVANDIPLNAVNYKIYIILSCLILLLIASIIAMFVLSSRIATTQIGMLVYKSKGIFVIPADPHNNTLEDNILKLKALKDLCSMEQLPIKSVSKVTRQGGTKAFIHGSFGTRCLAWRDKQKRDECISAIEMACGKRLSSLDLGQ